MRVESKEPSPGCVGVYTDEEGHVIASVSDFNPSGMGGCTLYFAQRSRVRGQLSHAIVSAYCSRVVSDALERYDCEQIVRKLKGRMTFVPIGHPDEKMETERP
jgi:hypothetical protein